MVPGASAVHSDEKHNQTITVLFFILNVLCMPQATYSRTSKPIQLDVDPRENIC